MATWTTWLGASLAATVLVAGCALATAPGRGTAPDSPKPERVKRVVASMMGEPTSFIARLNTGQISIPGAGVLEQLVNAALSEVNGEGKLQAQLAEAVPSLENGLWKLLPDGRMETTWKIRPGAQWHDRTPLTADDLVFTATVDRDNDLPVLRPQGYGWVENVQAPDPTTITVTWNRPFIDADTMFTAGFASPLPRHLLEDTYLTDKTRFPALSYWNQDFVGTGPFAVRQFAPGSSITLQANDRYALGRPKIDEIEVRFIVDLNTLMTNILAGSVELTLGRGFAIEQAIQLRDQWKDGRLEYRPRAWIVIHPQFIDPSPPVVTSFQFRLALTYGTDRQQLVDSIQGGLSSVAHLYLAPSEPEYRDVEDSAIRYEYDPRRALQNIEALGYTRGSDGAFRDASNQRLAVELRSNGEPVTEKAIVPVADMWSRLGVSTEPVLVPPQRITDREYVATFPSFRMMRQPNTASQVSRLRSSLTPLPENRFVGSNYARYISPEFDGLIDRFLSSIPRSERMQALRDTMRYISEKLNLVGLFYDADFTFLTNRLRDVSAGKTQVWSVHLWDMS